MDFFNEIKTTLYSVKMSEVTRKTNPKIDYYHALLTLTAKKKQSCIRCQNQLTEIFDSKQCF